MKKTIITNKVEHNYDLSFSKVFAGYGHYTIIINAEHYKTKELSFDMQITTTNMRAIDEITDLRDDNESYETIQQAFHDSFFDETNFEEKALELINNKC